MAARQFDVHVPFPGRNPRNSSTRGRAAAEPSYENQARCGRICARRVVTTRLPSASLRRRSMRITQACHRRAEVRFGSVPELHDERVALERLLNDSALDALAAAMNQAYFTQAGFMGRVDVLVDHRRYFPGCEGMQIERTFDGNAQDHGRASRVVRCTWP